MSSDGRHAPPLVAVRSADEARAADVATRDAGVPSRALMQRAGAAAAAEIVRRYGERLAAGVLVVAGGGNNGGDAWVVARALAAAGVRCRVHEAVEARTPDARAERALALPHVDLAPVPESSALVVDGLLGIGAAGAPRGAIADAIAGVARLRAGGAVVIALDIPSGVDASTGAHDGAVVADLTVAFGAVTRGVLVARANAGEVRVVDIGLAAAPVADDEPRLVDARWVTAHVPTIAADAHKGTRGKLVVVGGDVGMCGAVALAARAAAASGIGMVRCLVAPASLPVVQASVVEALAGSWPADDAAVDRDVCDWADVVLIGPGLGTSDEARAMLARVLARWRGPVVLDADALNLHAGRVDELADALGERRALITPHPGEFGRLVGREIDGVLAERFDVAAPLAARLGATVLLKGVPTVVSAPDRRRLVVASGTPVLATAGSGDLLSGIVATLLAQHPDPTVAAAVGGWVHGRAAALAGARSVRGTTLHDVLAALPSVWSDRASVPPYPALAELAALS